MMEENKRIRILHTWLSREQVIDFVMEDDRLQIVVRASEQRQAEVFFSAEETAYILSWLSLWYATLK